MKSGALKEKQFQMLKLGKKFTANVLKYPSIKAALLWFKGYQ
jgi:hypothetical protein